GAVGVGRMPMSSREGIRATSATGYLSLGATPPNLTIRSEAQVDRLVVDGRTVRGVRLVDGISIEAATVVLSGGVYGSPLILLRSGMGPADELRDLDVPVRADLPGV